MSRTRPRPVAGVYPVDTGTAELRRDGVDWVLLVNGVPSSAVRPADPATLAFPYLAQLAALVEAVAPGPVRALHLGGAGCALPWALAVRRPGSRQLVAELDGALVELVRSWFELPRAPQLRVRVGDARQVLQSRPDGATDVVVRDAFAGSRTPGHLCTVEFHEQVRRVLAPGGVYLANAVAGGARVKSEIASVAEVFRETGVLVERSGKAANALLLAGEQLPWEGVAAAARRCAPGSELLRGAGLRRFLGGAPALRDA